MQRSDLHPTTHVLATIALRRDGWQPKCTVLSKSTTSILFLMLLDFTPALGADASAISSEQLTAQSNLKLEQEVAQCKAELE